MMSDFITPAYQAEQQRMHREHVYGDSGKKWAAKVRGIMQGCDCKSVLDYGCGTDAMIFYLRKTLPIPMDITDEIDAKSYDPGREHPYDVPPDPADLVTCLDVLEHIEPEKLNAVLAHIHALTQKVCFVVISTRPAGKILSDGRNAHLIIEPWSWWRERLLLWFRVGAQWESVPNEWCAIMGPRS